MSHFTEEQKKTARLTDLYAFLMDNHGSDFIKEPGGLRYKNNHSICIHEGWSAYKDFATGETGNSIDFLVRYLGYSIPDAVLALCGENYTVTSIVTSQNEQNITSASIIKPETIFPEPFHGPYRNIYAYMNSRGIPKDTIIRLIEDKSIYQDLNCNIVFANKVGEWGERRGTNTFSEKRCKYRNNCEDYVCCAKNQWCEKMDSCSKYKKDIFHGIIKGAKEDGYWAFWPLENEDSVDIFVCEAGMDAISLYELHRMDKADIGVMYITIGGANKQKAIDSLNIFRNANIILAVDNDEAGEICRKNNPHLEFIIPKNKDWNADLMERKGLKRQ